MICCLAAILEENRTNASRMVLVDFSHAPVRTIAGGSLQPAVTPEIGGAGICEWMSLLCLVLLPLRVELQSGMSAIEVLSMPSPSKMFFTLLQGMH